MSLIPCCACEQRIPDVPTTAYWAWYQADGARRSFKQVLHPACYWDLVAPMLEAMREPQRQLFSCVACGIQDDFALSPLYVTAYPPGQEPEREGFALCSTCMAKLLPSITQHAREMPDRRLGGPETGGAAATQPPRGQRPTFNR